MGGKSLAYEQHLHSFKPTKGLHVELRARLGGAYLLYAPPSLALPFITND
jgi:hypothetical protein